MSIPADKIPDKRLFQVLYQIVNRSDHVGQLVYNLLHDKMTSPPTQRECQDALFRLWEVMHDHGARIKSELIFSGVHIVASSIGYWGRRQ